MDARASTPARQIERRLRGGVIGSVNYCCGSTTDRHPQNRSFRAVCDRTLVFPPFSGHGMTG